MGVYSTTHLIGVSAIAVEAYTREPEDDGPRLTVRLQLDCGGLHDVVLTDSPDVVRGVLIAALAACDAADPLTLNETEEVTSGVG